MSISAQAMNDYCMAKLREYAQGDYKQEMYNPRTMAVLAQAMKEYLEENLDVLYKWKGKDPEQSPDPVTSYLGVITFTDFNLDMPMTLNPGFSGKVMASVATGVISGPDGFSLSPGNFTIMPLEFPYGTSYETAMMECIFEPVCEWIVTCMPGADMAGTHIFNSKTYTGSGTMVSIS